jgi:hypothetical protein
VQLPISAEAWAAIGIPVNKGQIPKGPVISGNTFDLGGFNGHVALSFSQRMGTCLFEGNVIQGVDHVFYPLASATDRSQDSLIFRNNAIKDYRSVGRWRFSALTALVIEGNFFGDSSTTAPTSIQGYSGRGLRIHFDAGYTERWNLVSFVNNTINDVNQAMYITNDTITGFVIDTFLCNDNRFLSASSASFVFSMQNSAIVTVGFACMRNNIAKDLMSLSTNWTITRQITDNNIFIDVGDRILNSQGNTGVTGERTTTVGAAGTASALPANPAGYLTIDADGGVRKVPFYNA